MAVKERFRFYLQTDQAIAETATETTPLGSSTGIGLGIFRGFGVNVGKIAAFKKVVFYADALTGATATHSIRFAVREESCTGLTLASKSTSFESGSGAVEITIELDTPVFSEKDLFFTVQSTTDLLFHGTQGTAADQPIKTTTGSIVSNVCTDSGETGMYYFSYSLGSSIEVHPNYDRALSLQLEREPQKVFFRKKLNGNLFFQRDDYDFVEAATIEASYTLIITEDINGVFSEYYRGEFSKTDCEFNDDNKIFSVSPTPIDRYEKILADLEREFNLIDLHVPTQSVQYVKRPLFQVVTLGTGILSNHIDGVYWEQEIDPTIGAASLEGTYGFKPLGIKHAVAGWGSIDVSGEYEIDDTGIFREYPRLDNVYRIKFNEAILPLENQYQLIRVSDGEVLYETNITPSNEDDLPFKRVFNGVGANTGEYRFSVFDAYQRTLVDVSEVSGFTVIPVPTNDILEENYNYSHILVGAYMGPFITFSHSTTVTDFPVGRGTPTDPSEDLPFYHNKIVPPPATYPTATSAWHGAAFWVSFGVTSFTIVNEATSTVLNPYCYEISDVIAAILKKIDPTLSFSKTQGTSNFLHNDTTNPVSNEAGFRLFISPKSNIISAKYDIPATKAPIRLSEIFNMLKNGFGLEWYINEADGGLRIEHIKYFENGKDYSSQNIGLDLELLNEIYTGVPYSTGFNNFKYDKLNLPEFIKTAWMDEVSDGFNGSDIEIISKYVTKGQTESNILNPFTSDLDFIQSTPEQVNKEGFALFAASLDLADLIYKVGIIDVTIGSNTVKLQNGFASLPYMHDKFKRHGLPAGSVKINETETTASSIKRSKVQELETVVESDFDELELIKTDLGVGQIDAGEILFESDGTGRKAIKLTVRYDTE